MSDLISRLRGTCADDLRVCTDMRREAANEIERMYAENDRLRERIAELERELADKHESLKVFADKLVEAGMQHARDKEAAARWKWCEENAKLLIDSRGDCFAFDPVLSTSKPFAAAVDAAIAHQSPNS